MSSPNRRRSAVLFSAAALAAFGLALSGAAAPADAACRVEHKRVCHMAPVKHCGGGTCQVTKKERCVDVTVRSCKIKTARG
jgi:hypothetical protein